MKYTNDQKGRIDVMHDMEAILQKVDDSLKLMYDVETDLITVYRTINGHTAEALDTFSVDMDSPLACMRDIARSTTRYM